MDDAAMIPYTTDARPDTGVDNVTLGFWLFIASEVMLFGALFSSYALLRVNATDWPEPQSALSLQLGWLNTLIMLMVTGFVVLAAKRQPTSARGLLLLSSALAMVFLVVKGLEYRAEVSRGLLPSTSTFWALYFTLTGLHAVHVIGGVLANLWVIAGMRSVGELMTAGRLSVMSRYWVFVDLVWVAIFAGLYLL